MGETWTAIHTNPDVEDKLPSYNSLYVNQQGQGQQTLDVELANNNGQNSKEDAIARKQTLGERIVAKSKMLKNLEGDKLHVCILLFLYCLQGIPFGLKTSIPLILTR